MSGYDVNSQAPLVSATQYDFESTEAMSVALVLWAGAEVFLGLKYFQLFKENIKMESVLPINSIALTISVVTSFGILLAKGRFIYRILKARTDVNVFNHSIALCFAVSGPFFTFIADSPPFR